MPPQPTAKNSLLVAFVFFLSACNFPQKTPIVFERPETLQLIRPTGTPLVPENATSVEQNAFVSGLVAQVSAENLMDTVNALAAIHSRHVNNPGTQQAADLIEERFRALGGRLNVAQDSFELTFDGVRTTQHNVIARLPGSNPFGGIILIGAHYDSRTVNIADAVSRAPGANDNATGVAALIEIARLLANETPQSTIDFVAFAAEEVEVKGSAYYLQSVQSRGEFVRGVIIVDIVGNAGGASASGSIRIFSASPDTSVSRQLAKWVSLVGQTYTPGFRVDVQNSFDRPGRFSDHLRFTEAGIPSVRLIESVEDLSRQHTANDFPQLIDPDYLREAAQLALAALTNLAFGLSVN
jgi:Zn-dependent M28 family amino/carboxypeptidase